MSKVGNIRDIDKFIEKLWPWDWLNDCFAGKIQPTDIDGSVERNGFFLFLEGKSAGEHLPRGQEIYYKNLTKKLGHGSIVLILWADTPGEPSSYYWISDGIAGKVKQCDRNVIRSLCRKWFDHAESHGKRLG